MLPRADDGASVVTFIKKLLKRLAGFPFITKKKKKKKKLRCETRRRFQDLKTVNLNVTVQQQKQHRGRSETQNRRCLHSSLYNLPIPLRCGNQRPAATLSVGLCGGKKRQREKYLAADELWKVERMLHTRGQRGRFH